MATFYLDFENGNDSNDGLSFANRWKTLTNGATAARLTAGDTIRIMKSTDPVSLGVNGTFTKASPTITLSGAVTANIDLCEVAWTSANANVTAATNSACKQGTVSCSVAPNAAFTTGLMAYKATGLLDLSAYQNISFWMRSSVAIAANAIRIDLCSDVAGATPVHSFTIDTAFSANIWKPITFKNGAALSATIRSVALTALTDFGAATILIDNIFACNNLHLNSLIGTSSSPTDQNWFCLKSINTTTLILDYEQNTDVTQASPGYYTTVTTTVYARDTIRLTSTQVINKTGSVTARIIYSFGWDRTNMSTQDGLTFVSSDRNITGLSTQTFSFTTFGFINFERLGVLWGARPVNLSGGSANSLRHINCSSFGQQTGWVTSYNHYFENFVANCSSAPMTTTSASVRINTGQFYSNASGLTISSGAVVKLKDTTIISSFGGINIQGVLYGTNITITSSQGTGINCDGYAEINGLTCSDSLSNTMLIKGILKVNNANILQASTIQSFNVDSVLSASRYTTDSPSGTYVGYLHAGNATVVKDVNTPVHGSATRSYNHTPTAESFSGMPIVQPLQPFAVNGGSLVTFKIWVRRSSTDIEGRVRLKGYVTPGVNADVTATITAAINTWQELTVTCTPSSAGVVQIDLESYSLNGGSGNIYFGDATVTQA